ncbi:MAG TPA: alpha/beta fold hydrolase, partial [Longimicrobiales bacterium]
MLFLAVVVALGPRVPVDTSVEPVEPAADLDLWLAESEAELGDLVPGAEKTIVWADAAARAPTPRVVVYIHGFSADRQETAPLADSVAAALGANLFYTRLTGHGRSGEEAMAEASVHAWVQDAEEAMAVARRLGGRVVLVGASTGGTLATWMAAQPRWKSDIEALVLISPNFGPRDGSARILTWPWGGLVARLVVGPTRSFAPVNERQAEHWTVEYPTGALLPMMALVDLASDVDGRQVSAPVLVVYSPEDRVVDPARTLARLETLASSRKELFVVEGSDDPERHVLA